MSQLLLSIGLRDSATFSNYFAGINWQVLDLLQHGDDQFIYLWGGAGSGKTHLLQALCQQLTEQGAMAAYLPLSEPDMIPEMLQGMEAMDLVALDDIQHIAGKREWETALFHLYNRMRDVGHRLLVASNNSPAGLRLGLADLASRLGWGLTLQLQSLADEDKLEVLRLRAKNRGFNLPTEVGSYLLKHYDRDMTKLLQLLERLDTATLEAQRKLTIPFVKSYI